MKLKRGFGNQIKRVPSNKCINKLYSISQSRHLHPMFVITYSICPPGQDASDFFLSVLT